MTEIKIEDILQNFDSILKLTGQDSYVNWESFTKNSTQFIKNLDELAKSIAILREVQHKKFIVTMKKLKGSDIPDLIKTVKAKKLPKEALKTIIGRFKLIDGKIELVDTVETLKNESTSVLTQYLETNNAASKKAQEAIDFLKQTIKDSGFYQQPQVKQLVSTFTHSFPQAKLQEIKDKIQIQYLPGTVDTIHLTTYAQIVDNTYEVVKSEYKRLTEEARVSQRKLTNQTEKYIASLIEYLTNTEVLILEGQKAVGAKIGLSSQRIQQSEIALMERGLGQNILFIQSGLRTKVKQSMPAQKDVSLQSARQILEFQVTLLTSQLDYFKKLFSGLEKNQQNLQLVPMILALSLNDMVYEKYSLQQEDIMKNVTDEVIMTNPQFSALFKNMEMHIIKLMEQIGAIPEQVSQYMQNQSFPPLASQLGSAPNPNSNLLTNSGVLPGSNPMDLLQLQQYQQFYQMQQQLQAQQSKK